MPFLPLLAASVAVPAPSGPQVPVAASTAVREQLASPRRGEVLAAFPAAVYVRLDDGDVLALVTTDALRLPNALALAAGSRRAPFARHTAGAPAEVRGGALCVGELEHVPVRWWTPRTTSSGDLAPAVVHELAERLPDALHAGAVAARLATAVRVLQTALQDGNDDGASAVAQSLLGLGPGLTPAGDDVLAGALVTCAQLGRTRPAVAEAAAALGRAVVDRPHRTTALSAALLRHAAHGRAAEPVLAVLDALTGQRALGPALRDLLAVGSTSGADTAAGILAAARALCGGGTDR